MLETVNRKQTDASRKGLTAENAEVRRGRKVKKESRQDLQDGQDEDKEKVVIEIT